MLFVQNGHLDKQAAALLSAGRLSSGELLQAAEHIAVCPECALSVAAFFEKDTALPVPEGFAEEVLRGADHHNKSRRSLFWYSLRVSAAACVALVILFSGLPRIAADGVMEITPPNLGFTQSFSDTLSRFSDSILNLNWEVFQHETKER